MANFGFFSRKEKTRTEMNKPSKDALEKVSEDIKEKKRKRGRFFKFKTANKEKIKPKRWDGSQRRTISRVLECKIGGKNKGGK
jgi:hypothetical protein